MQVRIFVDRNYRVVEQEFNEWYEDTMNIIKIEYSTCGDAGGLVHHSIAVFYSTLSK